MTPNEFEYNRDIPFVTDLASDDAPDMQTNTKSVSDLISVDHIGFNTIDGTGGYHKMIHQTTFSAPTATNKGNSPVVMPSPIDGFGQIASNQINSSPGGFGSNDTNLYYLSETGRTYQITNFNPYLTQKFSQANLEVNGYCLLPGNIVYQWGYQKLTSEPSQHGKVFYRLPTSIVASKIFVVIATLQPVVPTVTSANSTLSILMPTNRLAFQYVYNGSSDYPGFFWLSIGALNV